MKCYAQQGVSAMLSVAFIDQLLQVQKVVLVSINLGQKLGRLKVFQGRGA